MDEEHAKLEPGAPDIQLINGHSLPVREFRPVPGESPDQCEQSINESHDQITDSAVQADESAAGSSGPIDEPPEPAAEPASAAQPPGPSLDDIDWETTRYLAAATQLDQRYAWQVVRGIIGEPFWAVAPAAGADIVVVTRWALAALRRRALRDAALTCLLIILVAAVAAQTWLVIAVLAALAILVVAYERWVRDVKIISRLMLRGRFHAYDAPSSPSPRIEKRLTVVKQQQKGNLVVFRGRRAFVGSGTNVFHDRMLINVALGKKRKGGKRQKPIAFTIPELHEALEAALRDMGFPELRVGERLFVNGEHVSADSRLLPDQFGPPSADAPPDLLEKGCVHPTPEARTYLCAEIGGWKGQLVVSLFARAVQANGSLQVEWLFNVLPPLHSGLLQVDQHYEQRRIKQFTKATAIGISWFIPALISAPVTFARYAAVPLTDKIRERKGAYRIRNGYVFNYGSPRSIRENPASFKRPYDFVVGDELTFIYLAEHTMLRALGRFLKAHNVDMKQYDKQAQTLIKKVNKYNVGKVKAGNVAIGTKSRVDADVGKKSGPSSGK